MPLLFEPIKVGGVQLKNRLVLSPMCMYSAQNRDGQLTEWHHTHYTSRVIGGIGLIIQEATAVLPEGRISPDDLGVWSEEHKAGMAHLANSVHILGGKIGIQLAHAGRKASSTSIWKGSQYIKPEEGGWDVVAPSAKPFNESSNMPHALSHEDIDKVIQAFIEGAQRAVECGYDVVEIHAAHGYLIHEFLSPISNHREDEYGGSFDNRIRFLLKIVEGVKKVLGPENALFVRLSCVDYLEGGWSIEDSVKLSHCLKEVGVDLIDCSSGAIAPGEKIKAGPSYQVPFSEQIKKEAHIMTGAVGLIEEAVQAESILQSNQADLILIGRAGLRDPYIANTFYRALHDTGHILPPQYLRAFRK